MNAYEDLVRAVADSTEPEPAALERVRRRLEPKLAPAAELAAAFEEPSALQLQRVRSRLAGRRSSARPYGWLAGAGLGLAAAAAAAVAVLPSAPAPIDVLLSDQAVVASDHVRLAPSGEGAIRGVAETFAIEWNHGALGVDVTPEAGVDLTITTPEAVVRVVGTVFDVNRDRLGTTVAVARGRVAVDCTIGEDARLSAGETHTCWPSTAAGLLGRARALEALGADPDQVLAVVDVGLDREDATGPVRAELLAASLPPLVASGRHHEALDHAEAYLVAGGTRTEIRRYAAALALSLGDCARARPHLLAVDARTPEEEAALQRCGP